MLLIYFEKMIHERKIIMLLIYLEKKIMKEKNKGKNYNAVNQFGKKDS